MVQFGQVIDHPTNEQPEGAARAAGGVPSRGAPEGPERPGRAGRPGPGASSRGLCGAVALAPGLAPPRGGGPWGRARVEPGPEPLALRSYE